MAFQQNDPNKVVIKVGPYTMRGFAAGEFFNVEFDEDDTNKHVGTDGTGRFTKNRNKGGIATLNLADYSPSNDDIKILELADIPFPISVVDKSTNAGLFFTASAKIMKTPAWVRSNVSTEIAWQFTFIKGTIVHSGARE